MRKFKSFTMLIIMLSVTNAWAEAFLDNFNRSDGDLGNDWATQTDGTITVQIVDNEVLIAGEQGTDWVRAGLSRTVDNETRISFDFNANDSFNVHIRIDDAETSAFIDAYFWVGGPLQYASSEDGSWPGWTEIAGTNMIAGEYNNLVLEQFGTDFMYTLNDVVIGTITNAQLTNIGSFLIASDAAAGTIGSIHIDNVQIGFVNAEIAKNPVPENGTTIDDTWVNLSWLPGDLAVSHNVYFSDSLADVEAGAEAAFQGNQTSPYFLVGFPGMPFPDGLVNGTTYYWRIDEVNDANPDSPWKGEIWSFTVPSKTAYAPDPADGAGNVPIGTELNWTSGFGAILHYVYFSDNFDDVNNATGAIPKGDNDYDPGTLEMAKTYYWRVDEFDGAGTHKGNIWSFLTEGAVANPQPADGAVGITQTPILTWSPGLFGTSHKVYFGTDPASLEQKAGGNLGSESYDPGQLEWNTTYYWRIDEANSANPDSPWTGPLWRFTTANYLIIDDMESYNDLDPADPASNRIFMVWIDGFEDPSNGSLVGYDNPPFAELTIVHSGDQSMPMSYDNTVGKSEATLTLTSNRDWTFKGINTLTIWFRGYASNAAENLYVALNNNAVVNHDDSNAARTVSWTEWNINLQAFADQGVNLTNVNSITIGLGNRNNPVAGGGSGLMFFDDIRLYAR
ncbi:MAG: hypothetical protein JW837_02430 [Sedimentisphaerales bacterium]|nr:hypothetical protein [Sedimentisphaerales bacterium]